MGFIVSSTVDQNLFLWERGDVVFFGATDCTK